VEFSALARWQSNRISRLQSDSLGSLNYFRRVPGLLSQLLAERGISDVEIRECPTFPAASIGRRAERERIA
jgi:hypothetical protein